MHRRTFIQGAALLGITPVLVTVFPRLPEAQMRTSRLASVPSPSEGADGNTVVFKIDGWEYSDSKDQSLNEVSIRLNQSWGTAWR